MTHNEIQDKVGRAVHIEHRRRAALKGCEVPPAWDDLTEEARDCYRRQGRLAALVIAGLVSQMRERQRAYFRGRTPGQLQEAREVERAVDAMLDTLAKSPDEQSTLNLVEK